jgi:hypothetical protein
MNLIPIRLIMLVVKRFLTMYFVVRHFRLGFMLILAVACPLAAEFSMNHFRFWLVVMLVFETLISTYFVAYYLCLGFFVILVVTSHLAVYFVACYFRLQFDVILAVTYSVTTDFVVNYFHLCFAVMLDVECLLTPYSTVFPFVNLYHRRFTMPFALGVQRHCYFDSSSICRFRCTTFSFAIQCYSCCRLFYAFWFSCFASFVILYNFACVMNVKNVLL